MSRSKKTHEAGNGDTVVEHSLDQPPPEPTAEAPPPEGADTGDQPNMPVHVVRFGLVRACVWLNHTDQGPRHNVTVSRLYMGSDNNWHSTGSFGFRDLLALAKCLDWAHSFIAAQMANSDVPF